MLEQHEILGIRLLQDSPGPILDAIGITQAGDTLQLVLVAQDGVVAPLSRHRLRQAVDTATEEALAALGERLLRVRWVPRATGVSGRVIAGPVPVPLAPSAVQLAGVQLSLLLSGGQTVTAVVADPTH